MWHGVPFACQRRPIIGVLRMCWLLPGSFDCFCCPHTSVHRPSIACLAVFLVLVASPALLCPSSLSGVPTLVPVGVAPAFCVSVLLLPLSGVAPGCPCRAPPPVPPACPPVRGFHISVRRGLSRARLVVHGPVATPMAGTSRRAGRSPRPCGVRGHLVEGGGVFADGSLGVRCIWWLLQFGARTSWFPCVLLCVLSGLISLPCVGRPCAQLFCCMRSSQFRALSYSAGMLTASGVRRRGGSMSLSASPCGCRVVPLAVGWCQGHRALLHMSPNLQTDLSLVFVGVVLG